MFGATKIGTLLLICSGLIRGEATEWTPWFSPFLELNFRFAYHQIRVKDIDLHHTAHASLGLTPWPYWNVEGEIFLTDARNFSFAYEAARLTIRYALLDDAERDPFALVVGTTATFPRKSLLHRLDFLYTAPLENEFHLTLGKEWPQLRLWTMAGYGFGTEGRPWLHGQSWVEWIVTRYRVAGFGEGVWAWGGNNLVVGSPFSGYSLIHYKKFVSGGEIGASLSNLGELSFRLWYTLYTRNCEVDDWGGKVTLWLTRGLF